MVTLNILCFFAYFLQVYCVPKPIFNGLNAEKNTYPYQVSLRYPSNDTVPIYKHFCGGSIIHRRFVLTAGHCMQYLINTQKENKKIQILVGTIFLDNGGVTYGVQEVIVHDKWNNITIANDLALIRTNRTIIFNESVRKIELATERPPDGSKAIITGWGITRVCFDIKLFIRVSD